MGNITNRKTAHLNLKGWYISNLSFNYEIMLFLPLFSKISFVFLMFEIDTTSRYICTEEPSRNFLRFMTTDRENTDILYTVNGKKGLNVVDCIFCCLLTWFWADFSGRFLIIVKLKPCVVKYFIFPFELMKYFIFPFELICKYMNKQISTVA